MHYARINKPYALSRAIRKYGEKSFSAEIIGEADSWDELTVLEINAIARYSCMCPNGYNMTAGGEGSKGAKPSPEKRAKISSSLTGRKLSNSHRLAIGIAQKGKVITDETRRRMSEAHKSRMPMSDEQRRVRSEAAKRQHATRKNAI